MFSYLVRQALQHRAPVLVIALLMVLLGGLSVPGIPVDVLPDLNRPTVTIYTEAPGLAAEEVEPLVSVRLEAVMSGLPKVIRVRSISSAGLSIVFVEFDWDTEPLLNRQLVAERLTSIRGDLPAGLSPRIGPLASIMGEVMLVALTGPAVAEQPGDLRWKVENELRPLLMAIPGVSLVTVIGGERTQYRVAPKLAAMRQWDVSLAHIEDALRAYGNSVSGGFVQSQAREYMIRLMRDEDAIGSLQGLVVAHKDGTPILLGQIATVERTPAFKIGDAGYNGQPAIILSIQKQPQADTLVLSRELHRTLDAYRSKLPPGAQPQVVFEQARFIERSVDNVLGVLRDAILIVAIVLLVFLQNLRSAVISLTAIPLSILLTVLVFRQMGLSINTMTLGGIAIAIGELVDDAVVDVENILRRLRQSWREGGVTHALKVVYQAAIEVRSSVLHATAIVVLAFAPLFALPGVEGRLFTSLGVAYIVSILASLLVAMTLTPVLGYYLLRNQQPAADGFLLRHLKRALERALHWAFGHARVLGVLIAAAVIGAAFALPRFDRIFLPPFNEDTLTVNVVLEPGTGLDASNQAGSLAETLLLASGHVESTGRRTGRAELDDHAEGVHYSELDVVLKDSDLPREQVLDALRRQLEVLPGQTSIGSPIAHRIDHLLSGVRAPVVVKLFGDDLGELSAAAAALQKQLATIPGLTDVRTQRPIHVAQLQVHVDPALARAHGVTADAVRAQVEALSSGRVVSGVLEGQRYRDLVLRIDDAQRAPALLGEMLIESPAGRVPLHRLAEVVEQQGPSQIGREAGRRMLAVTATTRERDQVRIFAAVEQAIAAAQLPSSVYASVEGQLRERVRAMRQMALLGLVSLALILMVLYGRYRSLVLSAIVLINVPLALVGSVIALAAFGQALSLASVVGFITLAGIATRNGILKLSHYVQLMAREGESFGPAMVVRGSLERLAPVLMTSLGAALALLPLLVSADAPGKEILHPVAATIFGGLISATLLDTLLTPILFLRFGEAPSRRLLTRDADEQAF